MDVVPRITEENREGGRRRFTWSCDVRIEDLRRREVAEECVVCTQMTSDEDAEKWNEDAEDYVVCTWMTSEEDAEDRVISVAEE